MSDPVYTIVKQGTKATLKWLRMSEDDAEAAGAVVGAVASAVTSLVTDQRKA
jgi:hypothetical protein